MNIAKYIESSNNVLKGAPWYGEPVVGTLQNLTIDQVNKSPIKEVHSVAQILNHMLSWRSLVVDKLNDKEHEIELNSDLDWDLNFQVSSSEEWKRLIEKLVANQKTIEKIILNKPQEWFQEIVINRDYTREFLIKGIIEHDIYHLGQIRLILKILEVKDSLRTFL